MKSSTVWWKMFLLLCVIILCCFRHGDTACDEFAQCQLTYPDDNVQCSVHEQGNSAGSCYGTGSRLHSCACNGEGQTLNLPGNGEDSFSCTNSGTWEEGFSELSCTAEPCDAPILWDNSLELVPDQISYANGTEVSFRCIEGFELSGDTLSAVCNYGNWSSYQYPNCTVRSCSRPIFADKYVRVSPDQESYINGSEVYFECPDCFNLSAEEISTVCLHGSWESYTEPNCTTKICANPNPDDENVILDPQGNSYSNGSEVYFTCPGGYIIHGSVEGVCLCGVWTMSRGNPKCNAEPCDAPILWDNSLELVPEQISYANGTEVSFRCIEGFELSGDTLSAVCNYGNWSSYQYPNCTVRSCSRPIFSDIYVSVSPDQESYINGSEVNFECPDGFDLSTGKITACLHGSWESYTEPNCTIRSCSRPIFADKYVRVSPDQESYINGSEVNFECPDCFDLSAEEISTVCLHGSWESYTEPHCTIKVCPKPNLEDELVIVTPERDSYSNGTKVNFSCLRRYTINGSTEAVCWCGDWEMSQGEPSCHSGCIWILIVVTCGFLAAGFIAVVYFKYHYHRTGTILIKNETNLEVPSDNQQTYISKLNFEMSDPKDGYHKNDYSSASPNDNNEAIADLTNNDTLPSTV